MIISLTPPLSQPHGDLSHEVKNLEENHFWDKENPQGRGEHASVFPEVEGDHNRLLQGQRQISRLLPSQVLGEVPGPIAPE